MPQSAETKSPRSTPMSALGLDYGPAAEMGRRAFDQWTRGMFEYSHELSLFAMAQFNQDVEAWKALASCTSVGEIVHCQFAYAQKATADYAAEAGKLLELITGSAGTAFTASAPGAAAAPEQQPQTGEAPAWQLVPAAPQRGATPRTRAAPAAKAPAGRGA